MIPAIYQQEYDHYIQEMKKENEIADRYAEMDLQFISDKHTELARQAKWKAERAKKRIAELKELRAKNNPDQKTADFMAAAFKSVRKVTGRNYAAEIMQHVTTEAELQQWLQTVKSMHTKDGKLDKAAYCRDLNTVRDNMLSTISELKKAAEDYESLIKQYESNVGILEKEIRENGGKY